MNARVIGSVKKLEAWSSGFGREKRLEGVTVGIDLPVGYATIVVPVADYDPDLIHIGDVVTIDVTVEPE